MILAWSVRWRVGEVVESGFDDVTVAQAVEVAVSGMAWLDLGRARGGSHPAIATVDVQAPCQQVRN